MTQHHQIVCGCKICIHDVTYQASLHNWRKQLLICINNDSKLFRKVSFETFNAQSISSRYSGVILPGGEHIHPCSKGAAFVGMCDFSNKNIKVPK